MQRARGSACSCPRRRAPGRARTRARRAPGRRPGCREASGRASRGARRVACPRSGETSRRVGDPRREPERRARRGSSAAAIGDGAAHREAEQQRPLAAEPLDRRSRVFDAEVEPPPRLDAVADLDEAEAPESAARAVARATRARRSTSRAPRCLWPPFTQTTRSRPAPVRRISAPVDRVVRVTRRWYARRAGRRRRPEAAAAEL